MATFDRRRVGAGSRDWIVRLEGRPIADTADATSGEPVDGPWTTLVLQMPACRSDVFGREALTLHQVAAHQTTRWEIPYRPDMDPELVDVPKRRRLVHRDRTYEIVAASLLGRRDAIELMTIASSKVD